MRILAGTIGGLLIGIATLAMFISNGLKPWMNSQFLDILFAVASYPVIYLYAILDHFHIGNGHFGDVLFILNLPVQWTLIGFFIGLVLQIRKNRRDKRNAEPARRGYLDPATGLKK
jgi:hypothetical protein